MFLTCVRIQLYINCNWCALEFTPPPHLFIAPNQLCVCFYNVSVHVSNVDSIIFFIRNAQSKIGLIITVLVINNSKIVVCGIN